MSIALTLVPDFGLILLGLALRRLMLADDRPWAGIEMLLYYVFFPGLLFYALSRVDLNPASAGPLVLVGGLATTTGMLLALLARYWFPITPVAFASQFQCGFRYNTYIGLAVAGKLYGPDGLAAMGLLAGALVPFVNLAAVGMLARQGETGIGRELARNPLVLATLAGLLWNLGGLGLPVQAQQFLARLADGGIALGLLSVGAALRWRQALGPGGRGAALWILAVKLLAVPLAALTLCPWFGVEGLYRHLVLVFAALPSASAAYILTQRMGGDGAGVAWLVSASTLVAMLTLPAWLTLAG